MKRRKLQKLIFILPLFFCVLVATAQDVKSVDVKELSDSDIERVRKQMREAGLTEQEAINLARQRGATEVQIRDLRKRLHESSVSTDSLSLISNEEYYFEEPADSSLSVRKDTFETEDVNIFGFSLFNNKKLTFEPGVNIQTPKNYEIGIGDQMIVNVWGNSQNNYQLTVNSNGQILIPDVGPVYIAGMFFSEAEKKIKQRLTSIYADMGGENPQTFAQISIGELRAIKVNIAGEVVSPGTYTLSAASTVFNALYLSGGPDTIGSFRNIKVIRDNELFQTVDIYKFIVDADPSDNITLKDEDIIFVPPLEKRVEVSGEFRRNTRFEIKEGETMEDLFRFAGGFTGSAWLAQLQLYRKTQQGVQIIDVAYEKAGNTTLNNGDKIHCRTISDEFENRITIDGAVYQPGEYQWEEGVTLSEVIQKAGGLKKDAFKNRGIVTRENPDKTKSNIPFNVEDVVSRKSDIVLQPEDSILVKSLFDLREDPYIFVSGEVLTPGEYHFSQGMTLGDAIFLADGFTEGADSTFIEVARRLSYQEAAQVNNRLVHINTFKLDRDLRLQPGDAQFELQAFDQISVRQAPGFRNAGKASVKGEVKYAGQYAISEKGQRISDLVKMAGGVTQYAFAEGATFERVNPILGPENIAVDLPLIMGSPGSHNDLFLRDGDVLFVPEYIQTVKVSGSVQNPFSLTYEKGITFKTYIERSGGFDANALRRKAYIKYANGSTASKKGFIFRRYPKVLPGSEIIVPERPEKENNNTSQWLAVASTFSSIAVAIAAVLR
ncbi:SLBB domain-containing protein [Maribellus maritimus]|uniref:SLBB domain-containing protein n=1 Tax=Maribellus maritimus TaxID=2870838 RepID=UPI001EE9EBDC|nr:SLBB domain-containing protein [Maribellus maritimus]MCG6191380.1 SLBB domain-containing protein [Maribellus maritimus]